MNVRIREGDKSQKQEELQSSILCFLEVRICIVDLFFFRKAIN